jgi:hypothetical protein
MNKGQKSTIPYPDATEAQKILVDAKSDFLNMYASRLADRQTGLCYADVVKKRGIQPITKEEKYVVSEEELRNFRSANPRLYQEAGIFKESNPLHVEMKNETATTVELPPVESLFTNE